MVAVSSDEPTLSDFGGGTDDPKPAPTRYTEYGHSGNRCHAITDDGTRCNRWSLDLHWLCEVHQDTLVATIDHDPIRLIEATADVRWKDVENEQIREAVGNVDRRYYGGERR